jgi:hypothetical protein
MTKLPHPTSYFVAMRARQVAPLQTSFQTGQNIAPADRMNMIHRSPDRVAQRTNMIHRRMAGTQHKHDRMLPDGVEHNINMIERLPDGGDTT